MPIVKGKGPSVSVVVAAYDAATHLGAALESALAQSYAPKEIIVVDHGSNDETASIARRYADKDARIRVTTIPGRSGGPAVPRNVGIAMASGDWIAFLDSDDLWTADRLKDQIEVITRHPELVLVYSILRTIESSNVLSNEFGLLPFPLRAAYSHEDLRKDNTIGCSATIARAASIRAVGGFDESPELVAVEDYDLWLKLSAIGPVGFVPRIHGYYRVHKAQLTARTNMNSRAKELLARHQIPIPSRGAGQRPLRLRIARLMAHVAAIGLEGAQRVIDSVLRRPVPVWRAPNPSRKGPA